MAQQAVDWGAIQQQYQAPQQAQAPQQQQMPQDPQQMMQQAIQGDPSRLAQMAQFLTQGANLGYAGQEAQLGNARDSQIAELEKNYNRAVNEGELSVKEAERQYKEQVEGINKEAYLDSERTAVASEQMGLSNSAQQMGMQASDNARKNSLLSKTLTERDQRINTVRDRISQIGLDKNLDIGLANKNHDYALAGARAELGQGLLGQMFQMGNEDYQTKRGLQAQLAQMGIQNQYDLDKLSVQQRMQLEQMAQQQGYNLETMGLQQTYNKENMGLQHGYDLSKLNIQQRYTLEQMATSQGYNLQNMNQQQIYQLAQMATQNGYNVGMENLSSANQYKNASGLNNQQHQLAMKEAEKNSQLRIAEETKAYDLAVQRELAKFDPNTKEYEIRAGQLAQEREAMITELVTQAQVEATIQYNLGTPVEKPTPPKKNWYQTEGSFKKEKAEYNERLEAYNRYMENLNNPMSMFP